MWGRRRARVRTPLAPRPSARRRRRIGTAASGSPLARAARSLARTVAARRAAARRYPLGRASPSPSPGASLRVPRLCLSPRLPRRPPGATLVPRIAYPPALLLLRRWARAAQGDAACSAFASPAAPRWVRLRRPRPRRQCQARASRALPRRLLSSPTRRERAERARRAESRRLLPAEQQPSACRRSAARLWWSPQARRGAAGRRALRARSRRSSAAGHQSPARRRSAARRSWSPRARRGAAGR